MFDKDTWQERDYQRGPWDIELPEWVQERVNYLRLVLVGIVLASLVSSLTACSAQAKAEWQSAAESGLLTETELDKLIDENTGPLTAEQETQLRQDILVQPIDSDSLVAVSFASPLLTGGGGRRQLFNVVRRTDDGWEIVLQAYKTPLPPEFDFIRSLKQKHRELPCLQINQVFRPLDYEVEQSTLCYDPTTGSYQLTNTVMIPIEE